MTANKVMDIRAIKEIAREQGFTVELTNSGHLAWTPPDSTKGKVYTSSTPSDWRATRKMITDLRRVGFDPYARRGVPVRGAHPTRQKVVVLAAVRQRWTAGDAEWSPSVADHDAALEVLDEIGMALRLPVHEERKDDGK